MEGRAERSRSPLPWLSAAALLFAAAVALRWPGVAMYDSVSQYQQVLDGAYSDWHPPIMARTWALLRLIHPGTAPFFLIQMALWWGGLGLIAGALGRRQRHGAAALVLLIGACPLWLGWATVVLKDAQMAACLIGATGIAAWWADRRRPMGASAAIGLLILYATLVRGNAVFATVPFAFALFDWGGLRGPVKRGRLLIAGIVAVIALGPIVNRWLMRAEASHVERTLPVYDMAGIGHFARLATIPRLAPAQWAAAERRGCYTPFFWNPYGEPAECDFVGQAVAFDDAAGPGLMARWAGQVARHPIAYAEHRAGHLNATLRFWVGAHEPEAIPPLNSEPNTLGLGAPATAEGRALVRTAGWLTDSPAGWPFLWVGVAIVLLAASRRPAADELTRVGRALALSAAAMGASFAVVSIASDLRYHLWTMVAAALALVLLGEGLARRRALIGGAALLALALVASAARLGLAAPVYVPLPQSVPAPGAKA